MNLAEQVARAAQRQLCYAHFGFFALAIGVSFVGLPVPARYSAAESKRRRRAQKRLGWLPSKLVCSPFDFGEGVDLPELADLGR